MANRAYRKELRSLEATLVRVHCEILIGSSGAVTSYTGPEATSVTHTTTGVYTVVFDPAGYAQQAGGSVSVGGPAADALGTLAQLTSITPSTGTVVLGTRLATSPFTLANPASGTVIYLDVYFNLSAA